MAAIPRSSYNQSVQYDHIQTSGKSFNPKSVTQESWTAKPTRTRANVPYISAQDLNVQTTSYTVVPHKDSDQRSVPANTKSIVKWTRIILLVLRVCSWIGAAGLLVCVVFVKPIGSTMDWVIRAPPAVAVVHLTYAVYHLCRSAKSRTPASSGSYMVFGALLDTCLICCQVLIAILARNQLLNALKDGTARWETILGSDFQRRTIIYSTFLLGLTTAGLHLLSIFVCAFLAIKFRKIAQLPPDMNPLEDNLTARGHKKGTMSVSTVMSDSDQDEVTSTAYVPKRTPPNAHPRTVENQPTFKNEKYLNHNRPQNAGNVSPAKSQHQFILPTGRYQAPRSKYVTPRSNRLPYSALSTGNADWGDHPPTPSPESPKFAPLELQHLRNHNYESESLMPASISKSKYDFSNRSPRPLGLHPPTPREATPNYTKGFDVRILRNIDGNSSAQRMPTNAVRETRSERDTSEIGQGMGGGRKQYGQVLSMGNVNRSQTRVVSSGIDDGHYNGVVRMREVSGKTAEEGRAGLVYQDF